MQRDVAIIGLGNLLLRDEGLGVHVIRLLEKDTSITDWVATIEAGTPGLNILNIIEGYKHVLIVDAAELGGMPGTVYVRTIRRGAPNDSPLRIGSAHDFDLVSVLESGWAAGLAIPHEIIIVAVEPKDYRNYGLELTPEVARAVPKVLNEIHRLLATIKSR
jgi:hydrogenase maturation protease